MGWGLGVGMGGGGGWVTGVNEASDDGLRRQVSPANNEKRRR